MTWTKECVTFFKAGVQKRKREGAERETKEQ